MRSWHGWLTCACKTKLNTDTNPPSIHPFKPRQPKLLSLAYAVAVAGLLLLEYARMSRQVRFGGWRRLEERKSTMCVLHLRICTDDNLTNTYRPTHTQKAPLPLGQAIHKFYAHFLDDRDMGHLVVTHLYLLLGCDCGWCCGVMLSLESVAVCTYFLSKNSSPSHPSLSPPK